MSVSERDRNRLAALCLLVRPSHSLAARVQTLNETDRAQYDQYSDRMREWIERNDIDEDGNPGNAFARTLAGYGPRLPNDIATALHGDMPRILKTDSDDNAARKYVDHANA